jgi:DNA polymerase-3 subunit gamma/tau
MTSELLKAEVDVRNASLPRLVFEMYLLKISFLSDMQPIQEIMEKLDVYTRVHPDSPGKSNVREPIDLPERGKHTSAPPASAPKKNDQKGDEHELQDVKLTDKIWEKTLSRVNPPLSSKLSKASFKLEGNVVALAFNEGYSVFVDSIKKNAEYLSGILSEELGKKVQIKVDTLQKQQVRKKKDLKEEVLSDPMVKEVLELFDGRIVDVNPIPGKKAADAQ